MFKLVGFLLVCFSFSVNATTVKSGGINISENIWEYTYTINNDSLAVDIKEFSIFFDYSLYRNITPKVTPNNWNPLVFQPDLLIPDDGVYDLLTENSGISPNTSFGGFTISFEWLGNGMPDKQTFDIINSDTLQTIDSGIVSFKIEEPPVIVGSNPIPTLSEWSIILLLISILSIVFFEEKNNKNY